MNTFDSLGLIEPLLRAVRAVGYTEPTPIQDQAIPALLDGRDVLGIAQTYPKNNLIANNHMHEIGVYGKQTSCYFQALGQTNEIRDNLCYNGTRALSVRLSSLFPVSLRPLIRRFTRPPRRDQLE